MFIKYLESVMAHNSKTHTDGYMLGSTMTYLDIALWHTLEAAASQFPDVYAKITAETPLLVQFRGKIASMPKIAEYLVSERRGFFEGNSMM